ncbi:hypothetical protein HJFPF1_07815 [Paramyrothecium foliicola]|nr:hypothetical protein HJFPF1_07815 [Paramyrothecium foliicola]
MRVSMYNLSRPSKAMIDAPKSTESQFVYIELGTTESLKRSATAYVRSHSVAEHWFRSYPLECKYMLLAESMT